MKTIAVGSLAALGLLVGAHAAAGPRQPRRAHMDRPVTQAHDADRPSRVLVRYRTASSDGLRERLRQSGIRLNAEHRGAGALSVTLPAGELRRLALDPDVISISADARVTSHGHGSLWDGPTPAWAADAQHLRRTLGLPATASGGRGVGVAVIDSGIAPVRDLAAQIAGFYDFTAGGVAAEPSDAYGHGTHVAGLIAGTGASSFGAYPGIAPGVRLIGMKVLDANGEGCASNVLAAIEFAIEQRVALGIDVINLSLGHPVLEPGATDPLVQAVERATAAGIVVVASAGNFGERPGGSQVGYGGISSPGNAPSALTVGALRTLHTTDRGDDRVATYSSRGPTWYDGLAKPDILAPGHGLIATTAPRSTLDKQYGGLGPWGGYAALNGTSMAAAVTAGVVALMVEANRHDGDSAPLTPNMVKLLLQYTAVAVRRYDAGVPSPLEQGAGGLNAAAAIEMARAIDPTVTAGLPWLEVGVRATTSIAGVSLPWTQQVIWGDRLLWGHLIEQREPAWSSTVVWGGEVTWSDGVAIAATSLVVDSLPLWSTRIVWGSGLVGAADDGGHIVWGNSFDDEHIVWGNTFDDEHIVWGNSIEMRTPAGELTTTAAGAAPAKRRK